MESADKRLRFTLRTVPDDARPDAVEAYAEQRAKLVAGVEKQEKGAPKFRPSTAHRARKMRLPKSPDAPMKEREAFAPGDWIEWTPCGADAPVSGSVWSAGPGYANWWVVTDRSGVTGECHLMERDRLGGYKINGAAARSLRGEIPEQLAFEEIPQTPGARIPEPPKPYTLWEGRGFEKVSRRMPVAISDEQVAIFGTVRYYPHRTISVDGLEFTVKLTWHDRTRQPLFESRIFHGEKPIATLGQAESLGEAVRRTVSYARVVDKEAAERVYSEKYREFFSPEYDHSGICPRCEGENECPLYVIPEFDTLPGKPLCADCLGFRLCCSGKKLSSVGRAKRVAATRRHTLERNQAIAAWEKWRSEQARGQRRYRLEFPLDVALPSLGDSGVWGAQTPMGGDKERGWNWPCRNELYRVEVAGFKYAVKWDGSECVGVGYWQEIKNIVRSHRRALEEERRKRVLERLAGKGEFSPGEETPDNAPGRSAETPKRVLWAPGDRVIVDGRQGCVRSVEMGGTPVRVAWDGEITTSAVPAADLKPVKVPAQENEPEQVRKPKEQSPKVSAKPKVGDIAFSGERGRERAEILGHAYGISMLAGVYFIKHFGTGVEIAAGVQGRPAMKRAILADAVARGAAAPEPEPQACEDCEESPCACYDPDAPQPEPQPEESHAAAVYPELRPWLTRWQEGDRKRVLNLFCGPGGACVALRRLLRDDVDMICVDSDARCAATQRAAGCTAIHADVTTLDPSDPVFRDVHGLIVTPPCIDYTDAGKRLGRLAENIDILGEAWDCARYAAGVMPLCGGDHPDFGKEMGRRLPNGRSWFDVRRDLDGYSGETGGLMLEIAVWTLGLEAAGAPLEWVAVEQSSKLPEEIRGEVVADFQLLGWSIAEWKVADAADYGGPSHRVRALLYARRDGGVMSMEAPGLATGAAQATGLPEGTTVWTRGNRKTSGGNAFTITGEACTAITSKVRSWDLGERGGRFTLEQVAALVTMPRGFPAQGSRTAICQQFGDVIAPVAALALLGAAQGIPWLPVLRQYLAELYPDVHGMHEHEQVWEDDGGAVPGVAMPQPEQQRPTMAELLEKHVGSDWKPLEATADPEFEGDGQEGDEEEQPQGIAPVSREQRAAAWRIAAGEQRPEPQPQPEPEPQEPEENDEERREAEGDRAAVARIMALAARLSEQRAREADQVTGILELADRVRAQERQAAEEERQEEVAPEPEPEPDRFEELKRELEELRADVESWGAEVAALAVAEAERVVAEVAQDMRAAELLELRREAAAVREELTSSVVWEPEEEVVGAGVPRAAWWHTAWASAAAWTVGTAVAFGEGWVEGWQEAMRQ
ncbi:hypothetical protein [Streptomyces hesseae]|uniref:DNA (cytosine-5-)-methyltransferase n=1 Tax=Streptomyces hesseae TaxID=3075519 RepID=A0ABU2SPT6_9ACTN|nr:hypothetical protein [Streptomyces sp. DSM 40473]MDT0449939.1 hypothetical protein [Streptomyces sp. DSM 40473]